MRYNSRRSLLLVVIGLLTEFAHAAESGIKLPPGEPLKIASDESVGLGSRPPSSANKRSEKKTGAFRIASPSHLTIVKDGGAADGVENIYNVVNIEFDTVEACNKFAIKGVYPFVRYETFTDAFVEDDAELIAKIKQAKGFKWMDMATVIEAPAPIPVSATKDKAKSPADTIVRGGINGLTGKNVIVAVIDSGVDFHHPDFIVTDKDGKPTSRLLYFWDTFSDAYAGQKIGKPAPVRYPNGAAIGTIFNRADLTADLRANPSRIVDWDTDGHGTACAGLAAGNGKASNGEYAGVAPDADIIAIRIGVHGQLTNEYLIGAICDWLDSVAGERPVVISCSFGSHDGGHDGCLVAERQLDARFASNRKSRAICIAAGNEGDRFMHGETAFKGKDRPGKLSWNADGAGLLVINVQNGDPNDLMLVAADQNQVSLVSKNFNPMSNACQMALDFAPGQNQLYIFSASAKSYQADAYIFGGEFDETCRSPSNQIASPGTTANAITVGSYNFNDEFSRRGVTLTFPDVSQPMKPMGIGELSGYSNPGYRRADIKVVKPDLVAPGQWFAACCARNVDADRDTSDMYQRFNGTSAATPYTAGVVALMFEKKPSLTVGEIKNLLHENATHDAETKKVPNTKWGYGKLSQAAVVRMLKAIK